MNFRIGTVAAFRICVEDVGANRDWFQKFFQKSPSEDIDRFSSFEFPGFNFEICLADAKSPPSNEGSVAYWQVEGLNSAVTHAESLGAKIYRGPLRVEEIGSTILQIKIPTGHVFGLQEPFPTSANL